jgi:hypothetical protein
MLRTAIKTTSNFSLLLLAAMPLVYTLIVGIPQQAIRHKMKERLETQFLHTISVTENEVQWRRDGEEIWVNGRMFDIRSFHLQHGVYFFSGLYDNDETAFLDHLQKDQKNNSENNKQLVQLFQLLQSVYNNPQEEIIFPENIPAGRFIQGTSPLAFQYISIFTPPPQVS